MAKAVLKAAGGLSAADKETVKEWMVEGHEILRGRVAGSIPARGAATITPGTSDQTIPAGLYLNGEQTIRGDANLTAGNIARGITIFGVTGSYQTPIKAWGMYTMSITGNVSYSKSLYGYIQCSDSSLLANASHNGTQWGSNRHTVKFKRSASLFCFAIGPYGPIIGSVGITSNIQQVNVANNTEIGVSNYTQKNSIPTTIVFVEF